LYTLKDYKEILEERLLLPVKISKFIENIIQATEYLLSISKITHLILSLIGFGISLKM
jgi:hypothetical protein